MLSVGETGDGSELPGYALILMSSLPSAFRRCASVLAMVSPGRIKIKAYPGNSEPSPVSSTDSTGYRAIEQAVRQSFPDAVVAPGLMTAATDSRHFSIVSDAVFRFSPFRMKNEDLARFHGNNERLAISNYGEMIGFYRQLLSNANAAPAQ